MKQHLVVLCGSYYPNPSATGVCADIYSSLVNMSFDIDVICATDKGETSSYSYKEKKVYPISTRFVRWQRRLQAHNHATLLQISKIPAHTLGLFSHPNVLNWYDRVAYQQLQKINKIKKIDVLFSFGAPMAAHVAAAHFKNTNPSVKWLAFSFDSYGAQNANKKSFCDFERNILGKADCAFVSEEIFANCSHLIEGGIGHYSSLPYLITAPQKSSIYSSDIVFPSDRINLVYAGSFYKNLRNPEFLLNVALKITDKALIHLFCSSDCDSIIDKYVHQSNGKIIRHPVVPQEEIKSIYEKADILINVGNNLAQFKPSKSFEYMATMKPILNIYYDGFFDETLAKYPLCLQVSNSTNIDEATILMDGFITDMVGKKVDVSQMKDLLGKHGEESIRKMILNELN